MILTNQASIEFNHDAIDRDFVIFEVKKDQGDYKRSLIPDVAVDEYKAMSVRYKWGNQCYLLYRSNQAEPQEIRRQLESCDDDIRITKVDSSKRLEDYILAQLLVNAIPNLESGNRTYHNLTGELYYLCPVWIKKRELYALKIQITWKNFIKLNVVTFRQVNDIRQEWSSPIYLLDTQCGMLRRKLKKDLDQTQPQYEKRSNNPNRKNNVDYLAFDDLKHFQQSRAGVMCQFLRDVQELLSGYMTMKLEYMDEKEHEVGKITPDSMKQICCMLRKHQVCIEDTIKNMQSEQLKKILTGLLRKDYGIPVKTGKVVSGDLVLRIIHEADYYSEKQEDDPHQNVPQNCIVQHVTLENFLTERGTLPKEDKEDPYLHKVLQELGIKLDIHDEWMNLYDWKSLNYGKTVSFVKRKGIGYKFDYDRLTITPEGRLAFDACKEQDIIGDSDWIRIDRAFRTSKGKADFSVVGLVYESIDCIQVIRKTDQFTLPNLEEMYQRLDETRPEEMLELEPLREIISELNHECVKDKNRCDSIQDRVNSIESVRNRAPRKMIKKAIGLRSNLGNQINELYYEKTGMWIGHRMKDAVSQETMLSGILGIRYFEKNGKIYYYSGYQIGNIQKGASRACCIREVASTQGRSNMERYIPLLAVDFIRTSNWTVIPFPFKYLREWRNKYINQ